MKLTAALFAALLPFAANAQESTCARLASTIDRYDRLIAYEEAGGIADNSAPRETNRRLRIQNYISAIHANIDLLVINKCPPLQMAVPASGNESKYYSEALTCATDRLRTSSPSSCSFIEWKGESPKK